MASKEIIIWGIHAGKTGDADTLFLKKEVVALGWPLAGNLAKFKEREEFKTRIAETYPESKPGSIPISAGQLFRFVHEMKPGDIVVYPSKHNRQVNIARVEGDYEYHPEMDEHYPNMRNVKWKTSLPRTSFSQGALFEIGSAMSLFQVKNYAEEYLAALEGKLVPITRSEEDETIGNVVEEIEQTARDFILKRLAQQLKGHPLAHFVAHLLQAMGYRTRIAAVGPDGGIDIIAHKDELGFEPPIVKVQVKSSEGNIGEPVVSGLYGKVSQGEFGLFITLGEFTSQAVSFARSKSNLRLIDGDELVDLILQHYEQFDSYYKGLLPLKRVYIPDERVDA